MDGKYYTDVYLFNDFKRNKIDQAFVNEDCFSTSCSNVLNELETYCPNVTDRLTDIFERAKDLNNPFELLQLYIGRVDFESDSQLGTEFMDIWKNSKKVRNIREEEILNSSVTIKFVKELFNFYFRDELYGRFESPNNIILSSGAVDERLWGLPNSLKECITYALRNDWYGYSDSRGRDSCRVAISKYENNRIGLDLYDKENVVITMGATHCISSLADFILNKDQNFPVICGIPNYPPLVESINKRGNVTLVPISTKLGESSIRSIIDSVNSHTPLVMIQTVLNPNGTKVKEEEIKELILKCYPDTIVILDECHEWLTDSPNPICPERSMSNVIRVSSLSKEWSVPGMKTGWFLGTKDFVKKFYEYASTMYGGPASFFYTLLEILTTMELWISNGIKIPSDEDIKGMKDSYNFKKSQLIKAFSEYAQNRNKRKNELLAARSIATEMFSMDGIQVIPPKYSINFAVNIPKYADSYISFRDILLKTGVSFYPGILNFCFSETISRITFSNSKEKILKAATLVKTIMK